MWKSTRSLFQRSPWPLITFPSGGFKVIEDSVAVEEEKRKGPWKGEYYPVVLGSVLDSRYQVVGKLGFGVSSTVWLARDLRYALEP
jgi:hypothetical protein